MPGSLHRTRQARFARHGDGLYPAKTFVPHSGDRLPYNRRQLDSVFANAVIENVGDDKIRSMILNEMLRVTRRVFLIASNKFLSVEADANPRSLHWPNGTTYWWRRKAGKCVNRETLYILSTRRLGSPLTYASARTSALRKNRILGLPMTFTAVCESVR